MDLEIRQASTTDIPLLVELMREFHAEAGYSLDREQAAKSFEVLLTDPALGVVWIFQDDSVAVGYVVLTVRFSMEYGGLDAFIDDLYVSPAHRSQGIGRRGLESLFAECARRGILAVHVIVGADNMPARELYGAFGMQRPSDGRETLSVQLPPSAAPKRL